MPSEHLTRVSGILSWHPNPEQTVSIFPTIGSTAPDIALPATDGRWVHLRTGGIGNDAASAAAAPASGRLRVVYFYPKDDTPGCTTEACDFTDQIDQFADLGCDVLGVSPDSAASHTRFAAKHNLRVTLLSDADHAAAEAFGIWREKQQYGRTYFGIVRSTFLIDRDGVVRGAWDGVRVRQKTRDGEKKHVDEVREALAALR